MEGTLKELVTVRISGLKGKFKRSNQKIIKDCLRKLHEDFVTAYKAANNIIVICKKYYIKELRINHSDQINFNICPFYRLIWQDLKSHSDFVKSVRLKLSEEDQDRPYLYWTPKLHKTPFKHSFIAGSSKCTTKELSCLLTKILSPIKDGLSMYCNTKMSHNVVNNMWILKNSASLLLSLEKLDVRYTKTVQTFDFSTLYTSIPHPHYLLKSRNCTLIRNSFWEKGVLDTPLGGGGLAYVVIRGCAIILGTLLGYCQISGYLFGYSWILGYNFLAISGFLGIIFLVKVDFFKNNPNFRVSILVFY